MTTTDSCRSFLCIRISNRFCVFSIFLIYESTINFNFSSDSKDGDSSLLFWFSSISICFDMCYLFAQGVKDECDLKEELAEMIISYLSWLEIALKLAYYVNIFFLDLQQLIWGFYPLGYLIRITCNINYGCQLPNGTRQVRGYDCRLHLFIIKIF